MTADPRPTHNGLTGDRPPDGAIGAPNRFDRVRVDVDALFGQDAGRTPAYEPGRTSGDALGPAGRLRARLRAAVYRTLCGRGHYEALVRSGLRTAWLDEFNAYWTRELGNRPLDFHDFFYLRGVYRSRFQDVAVPDEATGPRHLAAWRDARNVHLLFYYAYKLARDPAAAAPYLDLLPKGGRVCEYGCGLAPMVTSIARVFSHADVALTCADIPTLLLHYTRWKFRRKPFVRTLAIDPDDEAPLNEDYDLIFCMTVFEHLPRPLAIAEHLTDRLKPGGHLVFDYVRSAGEGLDTAAGVRQRDAVLAFIQDHYQIVRGQLHRDGRGVSAVVARKN